MSHLNKLRRRITIQSRPMTVDAFGQRTGAWSDLLTRVPAGLEALSGRELVNAQALHTEVTHRVTVRYHLFLADPQQAADFRVLYENGGLTRYFNVLAQVNVEERNRWLELMCSEGLNEG